MAPVDTSEDFLRHMAATLASGTVELPAFPQVVINVQEAFKNDNYTPQTISRIIAAEPTLGNRLLNMANSTAFNATGRVIISLEVAITRLGAQKVYSVALAHAIQHVRRSESLRSITRPLEEIWATGVTTAHFSQVIAKRTSLPTPEAFVAGLLHGIGRLYIVVQCSRKHVVLSHQLVDAWHPIIAKSVLKNWQMSEAICEAVGAQAEVHVVQPGRPSLTDVLAASIRLARRQQNKYDTESLSAGGALARLNLSIEECRSLIVEADAEIITLNRALSP